MTTTTFSVRVGRSTKHRLEKLAKTTGRSRSFLAAEAIVAYLDTNEWQVAGITKALTSLDRGKAICTRASANGLPLRRLAKSVPLPRGYDAPVVSGIHP
jgi:RHH-type transcriptional regulator, rel operon repressor / antitoxin RelB